MKKFTNAHGLAALTARLIHLAVAYATNLLPRETKSAATATIYTKSGLAKAISILPAEVMVETRNSPPQGGVPGYPREGVD
ncbi:hypothetical protein ABVK25_002272 [Lepraria finkii]|uniref:Uncharacterized protein n=1 Tax=Lepraria finkii TaxID=1340010 RepID=A0ABR4BHD3_9LECA